MASPLEETGILTVLYASARAPGSFVPFLTALAAVTRTTAARLRLEGPTPGDWAIGPAFVGPPPARRLRSGRVYAALDLDLPELPALRVVSAGDEVRATLALSRPHEDFRAADAALLDRLVPHVASAAQTWALVHAERQHATRHRALAAQLGGGWLLLDSGLRALDGDAVGRALLGPDGRIILPDDAPARALRRAVDAAQSGRTTLVDLRRDPALHLVITPDPLGALALIRVAPRARNLPAGWLAQALDLTPAEARLAAYLADGETLASAATRLGWQIETARSVSKQIFARLGLRGQSDLLRLIHTGGLWLHPFDAPPPQG